MRRIDKHHPCNLAWKSGREDANVLSSDRVTDKHIRAFDWSPLQKLMQIVDDG
jgi:hypothetical protein